MMAHNSSFTTGLSPENLRTAFASFPSGVVAIAGMESGKPIGMAASSFTSVSLEPPLVSICAAKSSSTWPRLRQLPRLGLSVLSADQGSHCRALASKLSDDRFVDVAWHATTDGAVFVRDAALTIECSVHSEVEAGDHEVILLEIRSLTPRADLEPLVFHGSRFRRLVVEPVA